MGHIGKLHSRVYSELSRSPESQGCKFTAILDSDSPAATAVGGEFGAQVSENLESFADSVDAASIATPTSSHFSIAKFLLERGKHLLIEKPITESADEARILVELASANHCILQVGHIERFNPALGALEER